MRGELKKEARRRALPRRCKSEASPARRRVCGSQPRWPARHRRTGVARCGLGLYQLRNRPERGQYRALIGHKRAAIWPFAAASAGENPGILGIRARAAAAKMNLSAAISATRPNYQPPTNSRRGRPTLRDLCGGLSFYLFSPNFALSTTGKLFSRGTIELPK